MYLHLFALVCLFSVISSNLIFRLLLCDTNLDAYLCRYDTRFLQYIHVLYVYVFVPVVYIHSCVLDLTYSFTIYRRILPVYSDGGITIIMGHKGEVFMLASSIYGVEFEWAINYGGYWLLFPGSYLNHPTSPYHVGRINSSRSVKVGDRILFIRLQEIFEKGGGKLRRLTEGKVSPHSP